MIYYYLQLFLILCASLILLTNIKNKKKIYICLYFFIIFFLMAFRDTSIGTDTEVYSNIFTSLANERFSSPYFSQKGMYVYSIYNILLGFISSKQNTIVIANAFIICILACVFIYKNCKDCLFLSSLLFVLMYFYFGAWNTSRQYISVLIFANSLYFVKEKKIIPFLILNIIGFFIHTTAISFLIVIPVFLFRKNWNKWNYFIYIFIIIIISFSMKNFINIFMSIFNDYGNYGSNGLLTEKNNGRTIILIIVSLFFLILGFVGAYLENDFSIIKENYIIIFIFVISIIFGFASYSFEMLSRFNLYFSITGFIVIPKFVRCFKNKEIRLLLSLTTIMIFSVQYFYMLNAGYNGILKYNTFINDLLFILN